MAGRGPAPKGNRRRANAPARGEWAPTPGIGWQHGPIPPPPDGLQEPSRVAWQSWMTSWFAANWTPAQLPDLRVVILLYDQVGRGEYQRATELRLWEDNLGVSLKGQQDRRWSPPKADEPAVATDASKGDRYKHLRAV